MRQHRNNKRRRRPLRLVVLAALVAGGWWLWNNFGGGFGLGLDTGDGDGQAETSVPTEAKHPCVVRIEKSGIKLDGNPSTRKQVVEACRERGHATITATGDANYGDFRHTKEALEAAGVRVEETFTE